MALSATTVFRDIVQKGTALGHQAGQRTAIDWFRQKAMEVTKGKINPRGLISTAQGFERIVNLSGTNIGSMYMFVYDPKLKYKLPFYDTYPLIFPIEHYNDGFLGLNMHYLSPIMRAGFMDALYGTLNNNAYDVSTRLNISYKILKEGGYNQYVKPCVKRYLNNHVRSRFLYIAPDEWEVALMLPTHNFLSSKGGTTRSINPQTVYNHGF
jgi:hypothetical protein